MRAYKVELNPTSSQKNKINQTIGVCRFIYNFFISHNEEVYKKEKTYVSGYDFSKWLNNEFIPNNPDKKWIKDVSSKSVKQAIMNADTAFKKFFKGESGFPNYKKKNKQNVKIYFPKNNKGDLTVERHRIKIPTLGFVRLKEKGYIPTNVKVKSATVYRKADKYYISVLIDDTFPEYRHESYTEGIGVDLGIKDFAICSNNKIFKNINKTKEVKRLEKKLKREQRKLSRKYESLKVRQKNIKEEGRATRQNIQKQVVKVQRLYQRLTNIRQNYINYVVSELVKTKPAFITIEDLNVRGMIKNRHLAKAISKQNFYLFRAKLIHKSKQQSIEIRIVDRFYPSSKTCSNCGSIKKDLKLSDRKYKCSLCGLEIDRDKNASINLANVKIYKVA